MGVPDVKTVRLYLRLPVKIVDEQQVRDLHPAISTVYLPRQKSRRWCTVDFEKARVKELKTIRIDGKKVYVSVQKTKDDPKKKASGSKKQ